MRPRIRREPSPDIGIIVPGPKVVPVEAVSVVQLLTCEFVTCVGRYLPREEWNTQDNDVLDDQRRRRRITPSPALKIIIFQYERT